MSVVVVGLEHDRAPLDLLERVAVSEDDLGKVLNALADRTNVSEVVVLSTCLRTEVYAVVDRFHEAVSDVHEFLAELGGTTSEGLVEFSTVLFDDAVDVHIFEVAAGLRSAVPGETEVLGQVRRAVERAESENVAGPVLSGLFREAVKAGRRVRSSTAISQGTTSLSHVAVDLVEMRLGGSLAGRRVLVVGAGEIAEGVVQAVSSRPGAPPDVRVANRTLSRAQGLASRFGARPCDLSVLAEHVGSAEAVIVTTRSAEPLLDVEMLGELSSDAARGRPLIVVDMGVPRNVDPALRGVPGIDLLDMYDLRAHAEKALEGRRAEVAGAEEIVFAEVGRYRADRRARGAVPIVAALRGRIEEIRKAELQRHGTALDSLGEQARSEVEAITRDVIAKLLHQPTVTLKETAGTSRGERLVEALRALFDL